MSFSPAENEKRLAEILQAIADLEEAAGAVGLWQLDRGKPEARRDRILMIHARNVYRKVTRKIYDFRPEQLANLTAIVWLYRGQQERFLDLVNGYFGKVCEETARVPDELAAFDRTLAEQREQLQTFAGSVAPLAAVDAEKKQPLTDALSELAEAQAVYEADRKSLVADPDAFGIQTTEAPPTTNAGQHAARAGQLAQDLSRDETVGANLFAHGPHGTKPTSRRDRRGEFIRLLASRIVDRSCPVTTF